VGEHDGGHLFNLRTKRCTEIKNVFSNNNGLNRTRRIKAVIRDSEECQSSIHVYLVEIASEQASCHCLYHGTGDERGLIARAESILELLQAEVGLALVHAALQHFAAVVALPVKKSPAFRHCDLKKREKERINICSSFLFLKFCK
jgi:hypothetical protein